MRKTLMFGAAILVLTGCANSPTSPAPIHSHVKPLASIICPPGYSGWVVRTGNGDEEVCVPSGQF